MATAITTTAKAAMAIHKPLRLLPPGAPTGAPPGITPGVPTGVPQLRQKRASSGTCLPHTLQYISYPQSACRVRCLAMQSSRDIL